MSVKKYWFWIVISTIIISWFGNTLYFKSKQLDAPIFLTHYINLNIEEEVTYLSLYYITNKTDFTELQQIQMEGLTLYPQNNGFFFMNDQNQQQYHQEFTHHYLKKATFEIHKDQFNAKQLKDGLEVEKIEAVFSQSPSKSMPVGQIHMNPNEVRNDLLRNDRSSGSSNGDFQSNHSASEALTITELILPFGKQLEKEYEIKLTHNHQSYFAGTFTNTTVSNRYPVNKQPIQMKENDTLLTKIQLNTKSNKVLNIQFILRGQSNSGKKFQTSINAYLEPYLTQSDINSYIERASEVK